MKPFTLKLRQEPPQRVDLSILTPDRLAGLSSAQIEKIDIGVTKFSTKVGDIFEILPGDLKNLRYEGGSSRFDLIGAKLLPDFSIHVDGDVGAQIGRLAHGGRITVAGSAGAYAASGNLGAEIEIAGDAGDYLAAPLAGELSGMAGGACDYSRLRRFTRGRSVASRRNCDRRLFWGRFGVEIDRWHDSRTGGDVGACWISQQARFSHFGAV